MADWKMLTLVGRDRPGIVAAVTRGLFDAGINLGEASMTRIGGNFAMLLMVNGAAADDALEKAVETPVRDMDLHLHVMPMDDAGLHRHKIPNYQVRVMGADRAGIVAQVTERLLAEGFNILELESDVAGTAEKPVYIMNIAGYADADMEALQDALDELGDIDVSVSSVETLIG
jgi:glycine cleavage system transcriptional repressor